MFEPCPCGAEDCRHCYPHGHPSDPVELPEWMDEPDDYEQPETQ